MSQSPAHQQVVRAGSRPVSAAAQLFKLIIMLLGEPGSHHGPPATVSPTVTA